MAATAGHYAIQTPRSEHQTVASINADDLSFGSQEPSFVSPSKLKQLGPQKFINRLTQPTGSTPLAEIKNGARPARLGGKNEFTPLLKSVTKSKHGLAAQTPSKLRHTLAKSASTSNLPGMESIVEYSGMSGEGEETPTQNENQFAEMSSASVSFQRLPGRSPGSADGAAALTLREQEKVIDAMRKENFSLKLKIFFMQDRLGKLAPEHLQAVLKENVEFKVEQATLRNELKKYKRSLVEAERNVARMAEEIKATKHSTDPSFVCPLDHGMSEEEAALLKQAQEEAEEARDNAMFAKKEVEDLKRELWEVRKEKQRLENDGGEDVAALEKEIEDMKGINEDLDLENKQLKEQIEQKEDELDVLQDQLADEKRRVTTLESQGIGPTDDDELAQQLEESEHEIRSLNEKIAEVEGKLQEARADFESEKEQLQSMALEHKTACEKVEQDLKTLQDAYDNLERELTDKEEELQMYQKDGGMDGGGLELQDLRGKIRNLESEKTELETQIRLLQKDAAQLLEKDGRVAKERSEERKILQTEIEELQIQLRETLDEKDRVVSQYENDFERLEERLNASEEQKVSLKKQIETFLNEEHTANGEYVKIQQALRDETERHQKEVDSLQKQISQLSADLKEGRRLHEELETEINILNEELRNAKRAEDILNNDLQELRRRIASDGRDSEYLKKLQSENVEFKSQIAALQESLDSVSAQRDRLTRELNDTHATHQLENLEKEYGSVRAERDDLRKSTMAAQITVAKLKPQIGDLEKKLATVTCERDSFESQVKVLRSELEDTKHQVEIQSTRLRTMERNLQDAREDLERERTHAQNLLATHNTSPQNDKTHKLNAEVRRLENLVQQSRLRQAELGKTNATQLDQINTLNRCVERLEGELEAIQGTRAGAGQIVGTVKDERALHTQLTLAKGQLADIKDQLAQQEREFNQRLADQLADLRAKSEDEKGALREEIESLKERHHESVQTKIKLEEEIRSLNRQISRLESEVKIYSAGADAGEKDLLTRLNSIKKELDVVREDAEQNENKSQKQIRRLELELASLRDHTEALNRDLYRQKRESDRQLAESQLLRKQLQESRDTLRRLKTSDHAPSASTMVIEKRHSAELRGLGKQIRYLKAKFFREQAFRMDLQYAKKFFLIQISSFESFNYANLALLRQMGIYPDPAVRARRPKLKSVALSFIAIVRMRRLKDEWREHLNAGRELKETLKGMKSRKAIVV